MVVRDRLLLVPDRLLLVPDRLLLVPDRLLLVPDRLLLVPDRLLLVPDRLLLVPGRLLSVPDRLLLVPGRLLFNRDIMSISFAVLQIQCKLYYSLILIFLIISLTNLCFFCRLPKQISQCSLIIESLSLIVNIFSAIIQYKWI